MIKWINTKYVRIDEFLHDRLRNDAHLKKTKMSYILNEVLEEHYHKFGYTFLDDVLRSNRTPRDKIKEIKRDNKG